MRVRGCNEVKLQHIGENLKRIREQKGLTQKEMATLLGYSYGGYVKIELGERGMSTKKIYEAADIIKCSPNDIFLPFNMH
jgi:transcriptional regulator with XRE-family HTH domain